MWLITAAAIPTEREFCHVLAATAKMAANMAVPMLALSASCGMPRTFFLLVRTSLYPAMLPNDVAEVFYSASEEEAFHVFQVKCNMV